MLADKEWDSPREIERLPTTDEVMKDLRRKAGTSPITIGPFLVAGVALVFAVVLEWLIALQTLFLAIAIGSAILGAGHAAVRFILAKVQANAALERMRPEWEKVTREREDEAMQQRREKLLQSFRRLRSENGARGAKEVDELTSAYEGMWEVLEGHASFGHVDAFSVPRAKLAARAAYRRALQILGLAATRMYALQRTDPQVLQTELGELQNEIAGLQQKAQSDQPSAALLQLKKDQYADVADRLASIGHLKVQIEQLLRASNIAEKAFEDSMTKIGDVEAAASDNVINQAAEDLRIVLDTALRVQEVLRSSRFEA